jgi:thioester reductase-like protein
MNILLTGSTGLIGQRMTRKLAHEGHKLFLLVRPSSKKKAQALFKDLPSIIYIVGDIEDTDVVKNIYSVSHYIDEIECLVHLAAYYNLEATLSEAYIKNVLGTQNIIQLISKMKELKYFHYFSTYAVNPKINERVLESELTNDDRLFQDDYAKTKNHAEHLVRKLNLPKIKTVIHRPGIVIGDSKTGQTEKEDGVYFFFNFIEKLKKVKLLIDKLPALPMLIGETSKLPILPVDILAEWSSHIISNPPAAPLSCYHLISDEQINTKKLLERAMVLLGFPLKLMPIKTHPLLSRALPFLKIPKEAAFYMNQTADFDRSQLTADYPNFKCPRYEDYLPQIIRGFLEGKK